MKCAYCGIESDNETGFTTIGSRLTRRRVVCATCLIYRQHESSRKNLSDLGVGLLFSIIWLLNQDAPWFLLNFYLLVVMLYVSIVPHELGHALGAWLTRAKLLEISFGQGRLVYSSKQAGVYVGFRAAPVEGFVTYFFCNNNYLRLRNLLVIAMGPGTNILLFFVVWHLFDNAISQESFYKTPAPVFTFAIANLFTGVSNLLPFQTNTRIGLLQSDGLSLIKTIFNRDVELLDRPQQLAAQSQVASMYRDYEAFRAFSEKAYEANRNDLNAKFSYAVAVGALGDYEDAIKLTQELVDDPDLDDNLRAIGQSNLAYYYILLADENNYSKAIKLAGAAMERCPWELSVLSNYGGIHVLAGDVDKGLEILTDKRFVIRPAADQAEIEALLAIGYAKKGSISLAKNKLQEAEKLDENCKFLARVEQFIETMESKQVSEIG